MSGEISIGELVGGVSLNDQFSGPINDVAKGLGVKLGESLEAASQLAGLAAGAIVATTAAIVAMGERGAGIVDVQDAFAGLSARAGESAEVMLGALQKGTLDTISNFELMARANKLLGSGLVTSSADMGTLAAGAKLLADRTGGDTTEALDKLTKALSTGKDASLAQMGVFVDTRMAVEGYARSLGKSTSDLTEHEKATGISQATLAALRGELAAAGPASADFADKIAQGKVAVQNLVDSFSVAIATSPVLAAGMDALRDAIKTAFGGTQQEIVKTLIGYVNQFGIFLVQVAQAGVMGAQFLANAWSGLKVIFNEFMALFVGQAGLVIQGVQAIVTALQPVQDLARTMGFARDGIDDAFDGIKRGVAGAGATVEAMRQSFKDQSAEALDNAAKQNEAFGAVQTKLQGLEGIMRTLAAAQTEGAAASEDAAGGLRQIGEQAGLTAAQLDAAKKANDELAGRMGDTFTAIAEKHRSYQEELAIANTTGLERRLLEIDIAHQRELDSLAEMVGEGSEAYRQLAAEAEATYATRAQAAVDSFAAQAESAVRAGMTQREQLQLTLDAAKDRHKQLVDSDKATNDQIVLSAKAVEQAQKDIDEEVLRRKLEQLNTIASSASGILRSLFGKNKAAAIAATIIDTAAAVVTTFRNAGGWPWGIIPAAAMAAAGYAQIQQIRNTNAEGFAQGTPDMAFMDFGRATAVPLHGDEAVVNKAQGATLADMVVEAVELRDDRVVRQLERMEEAAAVDRRLLPLRLRDAFAGA